MTEFDNQNRLLDFRDAWTRFSVVAFAVVILLMVFSVPSEQIIILTAAICVLAALVVFQIRQDRQRQQFWDELLKGLPIPFALAVEPGVFKAYVKIVQALTKVVDHSDLLFRDLSLRQLESVTEEIAPLARGQIIFHATETWRTAYQHVLETLRVKTYYSVALVRTNEYWNDVPGRQSMRFNYELIGRGFRIERIHILSDAVWPFEDKLPGAGILEWLVEQQGRGIHVSLARESDLAKEPDLLRDFAVYGDRATASQETDEQSRTQRFILSFDEQSIRQALGQWERLKLFATSFQDLMDHLPA